MQIYNLEIDGQILEVVRDSDGKFIIPDHLRPMNTALKPAFEPIVLARKPLSEGTVAANVLRWRTGALNIDACRIGTEGGTAKGSKPQGAGNGIYGAGLHGACEIVELNAGRWPANVCHDGSDEVVAGFPNSAARFFYSSKASKADRNGSKHPTVKPVSLMEWLCALVTPPGGTVLDPFAGSGTTGVAARAKGFNVVLCEREAEYVGDILRRFGHVEAPSIVPEQHTHTHRTQDRADRPQAVG